MSFKMKLAEDEAYLEGRSGKHAAELLQKAESLGIDPKLVRTTYNGYIVPKSLVEGKMSAKQAEGQEAFTAAEEKETDQAHPDAPVNEFDPAEHGIHEVRAYLKDADDEERQRVLDAERNGKARKTLLPDDEGDEE